MKPWIMAVCLMMLAGTAPAAGFDDDREFNREDYEEEAGDTFMFMLNPEQGVYGISWGDGRWLKGTPVFGDFAISLFSNDIEESLFSGVGMTFRIMPHWRVAPFVGAGGGYNYAISSWGDDDVTGDSTREDHSYWGGHVESGIRFWFRNRTGIFELMGRYTWSSREGDERDYWLVGISTAPGW